MKNHVVIFAILFAGICLCFPQSAVPQSSDDELMFIRDRDIAVIPFVNLTKNSEASAQYEDVVMIQMVICFGDIIPLETLKPVLRKNRLRLVGKIDEGSAAVIREKTNVEYLITGSYDTYDNIENLQSGISLRVIDIETMSVLWAKSIYFNDMDRVAIFDVKEQEELLFFIRREMWKEHQVLNLAYLDSVKAAIVNRTKVAVVDFDNASEYHRAGAIATNQLISYLVNEGYNVIEPGLISELMINNQVNYRGEIDLNIIKRLYKDYDVNLIVTGTVEDYKTIPPTAALLSPEVEISMRFIDPQTQGIIDMYNERITGDAGELFFKLGKIRSAEKVSNNVIQAVIKKFMKDYKHVYSSK